MVKSFFFLPNKELEEVAMILVVQSIHLSVKPICFITCRIVEYLSVPFCYVLTCYGSKLYVEHYKYGAYGRSCPCLDYMCHGPACYSSPASTDSGGYCSTSGVRSS
jgi:hypothetical protein